MIVYAPPVCIGSSLSRRLPMPPELFYVLTSVMKVEI